ncbi:putative late embryogenesis abundant protein, LEA-14 [Tanacetum coccineum]
MGGASIVRSDLVVSFRETVLEKSCRTVMSKFPNKHNRLYMEARPIEEGLVEAIDEGRLGSPPHSSVGFHSRESSSTRFSGSLKPNGPQKISITFERFMVQAGSDFTGVATDMVTMNSTVKFTFRNTATFFGLHVTSTPLDLAFSQIAVGSGTIKKFYQKRKSQRLVTVSVVGDKVPLYGSGQGLKSLKGIPTTPVPLKLSFKVRSRGYVLGKLVKPKFYNKIDCSVAYDPKTVNVPMSLKNNCEFV